MKFITNVPNYLSLKLGTSKNSRCVFLASILIPTWLSKYGHLDFHQPPLLSSAFRHHYGSVTCSPYTFNYGISCEANKKNNGGGDGQRYTRVCTAYGARWRYNGKGWLVSFERKSLIKCIKSFKAKKAISAPIQKQSGVEQRWSLFFSGLSGILGLGFH